MESNQLFGVIIALIAMFTFVASSLNLEFFFQNKRAQAFVKLFGRRGTQIFYMALGAFLFYVAYQVYMGTTPQN
jgi:hypothetical protein